MSGIDTTVAARRAETARSEAPSGFSLREAPVEIAFQPSAPYVAPRNQAPVQPGLQNPTAPVSPGLGQPGQPGVTPGGAGPAGPASPAGNTPGLAFGALGSKPQNVQVMLLDGMVAGARASGKPFSQQIDDQYALIYDPSSGKIAVSAAGGEPVPGGTLTDLVRRHMKIRDSAIPAGSDLADALANGGRSSPPTAAMRPSPPPGTGTSASAPPASAPATPKPYVPSPLEIQVDNALAAQAATGEAQRIADGLPRHGGRIVVSPPGQGDGFAETARRTNALSGSGVAVTGTIPANGHQVPFIYTGDANGARAFLRDPAVDRATNIPDASRQAAERAAGAAEAGRPAPATRPTPFEPSIERFKDFSSAEQAADRIMFESRRDPARLSAEQAATLRRALEDIKSASEDLSVPGGIQFNLGDTTIDLGRHLLERYDELQRQQAQAAAAPPTPAPAQAPAQAPVTGRIPDHVFIERAGSTLSEIEKLRWGQFTERNPDIVTLVNEAGTGATEGEMSEAARALINGAYGADVVAWLRAGGAGGSMVPPGNRRPGSGVAMRDPDPDEAKAMAELVNDLGPHKFAQLPQELRDRIAEYIQRAASTHPAAANDTDVQKAFRMLDVADPSPSPLAQLRLAALPPSASPIGALPPAGPDTPRGVSRAGLHVEIDYPSVNGPWVGHAELGDMIHTMAALHAADPAYNGKINLLAPSTEAAARANSILHRVFPDATIIVHTPPSDVGNAREAEHFYRIVKSGGANDAPLGHPFDATRSYGQAVSADPEAARNFGTHLKSLVSPAEAAAVNEYLAGVDPALVDASVPKAIIFTRDARDATSARNSTPESLQQLSQELQSRGLTVVLMGPRLEPAPEGAIDLSEHWLRIGDLPSQAYLYDTLARNGTKVTLGQMSGALDLIRLSADMPVIEIGQPFRMGMWQEAYGPDRFSIVPANDYDADSGDPSRRVLSTETMRSINEILDLQLSR